MPTILQGTIKVFNCQCKAKIHFTQLVRLENVIDIEVETVIKGFNCTWHLDDPDQKVRSSSSFGSNLIS